MTLPLVVVALVMAIAVCAQPRQRDRRDPVDNLGGVLSVVLVGALIVGINFLPVPNEETLALGLLAVAGAAAIIFFLRQRRASNPLYDLRIAARPTFWVAGCAGVIVFGSLMGAAFISGQYLQNVLGYSTIEAGAAILPGASVHGGRGAPRSAKLVGSQGSRNTLLLGQFFVLLAFLAMFFLWKEDTPYWQIAIPYALLGIGVGLAGTPSSNSLTGSVPVQRAGMASGTADLQRDLGGALMTSIFGALLAAGYASAMGTAISESGQDVTDSIRRASCSSPTPVRRTSPTRIRSLRTQIISAAQQSFLDGDQWAYLAAIVAVSIGMALVFFFFPKHEEELELRASYHAQDTGGRAASMSKPP